jgi:hypothetical protein
MCSICQKTTGTTSCGCGAKICDLCAEGCRKKCLHCGKKTGIWCKNCEIGADFRYCYSMDCKPPLCSYCMFYILEKPICDCGSVINDSICKKCYNKTYKTHVCYKCILAGKKYSSNECYLCGHVDNLEICTGGCTHKVCTEHSFSDGKKLSCAFCFMKDYKKNH